MYMFWATREDVFTSDLWIMFRQAASADVCARLALAGCDFAAGCKRASRVAADCSRAASRRATISAALSLVHDFFDIVHQCRGS